jgi:hypothetical protein
MRYHTVCIKFTRVCMAACRMLIHSCWRVIQGGQTLTRTEIQPRTCTFSVSQTCSMGDRLAEYAGQSNTWTFWAARNGCKAVRLEYRRYHAFNVTLSRWTNCTTVGQGPYHGTFGVHVAINEIQRISLSLWNSCAHQDTPSTMSNSPSDICVSDAFNDIRQHTRCVPSACYPVRIRVRIDPPHPLVCRKRRLNGWDRKNRGPVSQ